MKQKLSLETWNRKEHFEFFNKFEEPFYGITTNIDCTIAFENAKKQDVSFFAYYLHKTLIAINEIENFRMRIIDNEVFVYETINASATIMREDKTFGFSLIAYDKSLIGFSKNLTNEVKRIQSTTGLFTIAFGETNLIHFSTLPWVNFTSLSHARSYSFPDSCPKITFGKIEDGNGQKNMPMSIHVHHGLVDGYHVGLFVELFQKLMNE